MCIINITGQGIIHYMGLFTVILLLIYMNTPQDERKGKVQTKNLSTKQIKRCLVFCTGKYWKNSINKYLPTGTSTVIFTGQDDLKQG